MNEPLAPPAGAVPTAPLDVWEPLDAAERRAIARRLGPLLLGAGLLGLGLLWTWWRPGQGEVAALIQAMAALLVGLPLFVEGVRGFLARSSQHITAQLVSLAVLAAMATGDFVTATLVPLFMELGRLFEDRGARGVRAAMEGLKGLHARKAHRVLDPAAAGAARGAATEPDTDLLEEEVSPELLRAGDLVLVRPGEVIPVDGRVLVGRSSVDQSPITGESRFEDVAPGSEVFAGSINHGGLLRLRTEKVGEASVLGRVSTLLREVEKAKTPELRLMERGIAVYLPAILTVAAIVLFVTGELQRAIAVLVVACPSALMLCGPVAVVAALTALSRSRILVKSAGFLEGIAAVRTLVLDKTGTVTVGAPYLAQLLPQPGVLEDELLAAARTCAEASVHPISRAVVEAARERKVAARAADTVQELPGQGLRAEQDGEVTLLGRASWLTEQGLSMPTSRSPRPRPQQSPGQNTTGHETSLTETTETEGSEVWVARGGAVLGCLRFRDRPRDEAREALARLRRAGIQRLVLLTGDRREIAHEVGEALGFDEIHAEVLPEAKLELVRHEQRSARVMMVGDGINDALALSGADVGVAVGARINDVALGGADVAIQHDDLTRLPHLLAVSRFTRKLIVQNLVLVAATSAALIALASLGVVSPLVGAWLHNVDALLVILNSSRVLGFAARGD